MKGSWASDTSTHYFVYYFVISQILCIAFIGTILSHIANHLSKGSVFVPGGRAMLGVHVMIDGSWDSQAESSEQSGHDMNSSKNS